MRRNRLGRLAVLLIPAFVLTAVAADDEADNNTLILPTMVVTASRTERETETVSANVVVITAEDISASNAVTIPDLLKDEAGIQVADWLGNGSTTGVSIGGFGETGNQNVAVLVDGLRADYADLSGTDWTAIPLNQVQRIEVLRSGNSALYGNSASGGVVNIITKAGGSNRVTATVEGSSWGYRQSTGISGRFGDLGYTFQQGYADSDGYRFNNHYRARNFHLGVSWDPQPGWFSLDLRTGRNKESYGLAGTLTKAQVDQGIYDPSDTDEPYNWATRTTKYVSLIPTFRIEDGAHIVKVPLTHRERDAFWHNQGVSFGFPWVFDREWRDIVQGTAPQWTWNHELGGMGNSFTLGVEYYEVDRHEIQNDIEGNRETTDIFVSDTLEMIENVFVDVAYRHGEADFDFASGFDRSLDFEEDAWHLGLTWNYADGSKVYGLYDRSYRFGVLDEYIVYPAFPGAPFVNLGLKPQISTTWKLGVRHALQAPATVGVSIFRIDTEDEIFYDPNDATYNVFFPGTNRNYDDTERVGATLEFEARPIESVRLFTNYTWMDAEFGDDDGPTSYDGNTIPLVPENAVNAGVDWDLLPELTWNVTGRWRDSQYTISDWNNNLDRIPSYTVVDTRLTYTWQWLSLYAGVNNVFDEEYSEYVTYGVNLYPSPGRQLFGGVQVTYEF